jgi:hypothetical protein
LVKPTNDPSYSTTFSPRKFYSKRKVWNLFVSR